MGTTKIEWTRGNDGTPGKTWNPLTGCTKVSPGCDHCYAKTMHERFNGPGSFDTVTLHPERLDQPLRWRKPRKVFVNSMSDLFHQDVPDDYIAKVLGIVGAAERHTFQLLTKRHARMRSLLSSPEFVRKVQTHWWVHWYAQLGTDAYRTRARRLMWAPGRTSMPLGSNDLPWPLPNLWLGVSVENQQWANIRIPALLDTPAAVRFISAEPLLGEVSMFANSTIDTGTLLDWVIVGGESGPGARPMSARWARQLRDECVDYGIPFLFKQWGSHDEHGKRMSKHATGRVLDGRTWDEYPERAA